MVLINPCSMNSPATQMVTEKGTDAPLKVKNQAEAIGRMITRTGYHNMCFATLVK